MCHHVAAFRYAFQLCIPKSIGTRSNTESIIYIGVDRLLWKVIFLKKKEWCFIFLLFKSNNGQQKNRFYGSRVAPPKNKTPMGEVCEIYMNNNNWNEYNNFLKKRESVDVIYSCFMCVCVFFLLFLLFLSHYHSTQPKKNNICELD